MIAHPPGLVRRRLLGSIGVPRGWLDPTMHLRARINPLQPYRHHLDLSLLTRVRDAHSHCSDSLA